jgi:phosphoribosylformylglycinamidine synthase
VSLKEEMIERITTTYPGAEVRIHDVTGGGDHWQAEIVAAQFEGMSRLARQRGVYGALGELMQGPIHAFTCRTLTPAEDTE